MSVSAASRHLAQTLADLAAEFGSLDVVRERREVSPDEYDRLTEQASAFDGGGGAGAWIRDPNGRILLVESDDGWREPGQTRHPGEPYIACARRAVRAETGLVARVTDVRHVHVRYCHDWTDRDPIPLPFVIFTGDASGTPEGGEWHDTLPDTLLYDLLTELPLAE